MIRIEDMAGSKNSFECRKIVVKLGSNVVMGSDGAVDLTVIEGLADTLVEFRKKGIQVIVVTSGAIGLACGQLKRPRPKVIPEKQAFAAIGQIGLMHIYQSALASRSLTAAQLLLTRSELEDRRSYLNVRHAIERLLELGAVPIINENDTISTDELGFGDNDVLSAYVAVTLKADLLVILSTVAGVLKTPPGGAGKKSKPGEIIPFIPKINAAAFSSVDDSRSGHGMGGMTSKLNAAKTASDAGVHTVIAGGKTPRILEQIVTGNFPGTYIPAARDSSSISARERWIGFGRSTKGNRIMLDRGAVEALVRKKSSLLPVGISSVAGNFAQGDIVEVCDPDGTCVARGLVNYSSSEIEKIKGRKTSDIESILGSRAYDEVIHRDHLLILNAS